MNNTTQTRLGRKLLSWLLVFVMAVSVLPTAAFAEEMDPPDTMERCESNFGSDFKIVFSTEYNDWLNAVTGVKVGETDYNRGNSSFSVNSNSCFYVYVAEPSSGSDSYILIGEGAVASAAECVITADGYKDLTLKLTKSGSNYSAEVVDTTPPAYVLMNIPYSAFYAAEGGEGDDVAQIDAVTSATRSKTMNANLAANSYHVKADGSDITGITYPVYVEHTSMLKSFTEVDDEDDLFCNDSYAYLELDEEPASYKELTFDNDDEPVFGKATGEVKTIDANAALSTNDRHVDIAVTVTVTEDGVSIAQADVCGVTLHTTDDNVYGLRHVYEIWRGTSLGFDLDGVYGGLAGQTIDRITYYLKDGSIYTFSVEGMDKVPYKADASVSVESVDAGAGTTSFQLTDALPGDFAAQYSVTGLSEGAVDADTKTISLADAGIGAYTLTIADESGKYLPITASFSVYGYVLMNIPYAEFYAAEKDSDDKVAEIDAVTSATLNKTRTQSLAGGSYHVDKNGTDITGITYPVQISDASLLTGYKEIKDTDTVTITVTNRGQTSTMELEGKATLFENESYAYYVLDENPGYYKTLTNRRGVISFGKATGKETEVSGVTPELTTGAKHTYYEINVGEVEGISQDNVSGVTLHTTENNVYGLRHVYEIWRGTELGFDVTGANGDYAALQSQTIDKITYYLNDGTILTIQTELKVPKSTADCSITVENALVDAGKTAITANLPDGFQAVYTVKKDENEVTDFTVSDGKLTWSETMEKGTYTLTAVDESGTYASVSTTFDLQDTTVYAKYDAESKELVKANEVISDEEFAAYLKAISAVLVDETSYAASGRGAVTIIQEDGSVDLTAAPFNKGDNAYDVVVKAAGYQDLPFLLTAGEVSGTGALPGIAGEDESGRTYTGLFKPCILQEDYNRLWHDYTAAVVGKTSADTMVDVLKYTISGKKYGQDAIDAGIMQFCCEFINGAKTITFGPNNTISIETESGTVSPHTYNYLGTVTVGSAPMSFQGDLYMTDDEDAGEFTYFLLRDDTPEETYHIEFRYGSDLGQLKGYLTGDYAYWLAAGIPQDADEAMIENCIALFCLENMDYTGERSEESVSQIADLVGTWDYYVNGAAAPDTLYFTVDQNGNGQSYYQGKASASYQVYAYDNDGDPSQKSGIYVTYDEEGAEWAKYTIHTSGSSTVLTLTGVADGNPYSLTYVKHVSTTPGTTTSSGGSSSGSGYAVSLPTSVKNGKITASPRTAEKGDTVTITVTPDSGYELDSLKVTDKNGDTVKLTRKSDTQYTFTMPASKVTVTGSFTESAASGLAFVDVAAGAYYYDAVAWAVEEGITSGTTATTFGPSVSCTRAQTVTFLWRAAGSPAPKSSTNPFTDVAPGAYYYDAVLWAVEQGITTGTTATTFSPNNTVTRGQTVTFLYRAAGSPAVTGGNSFADVAADAYYTSAVNWAVSEGVTSGTTATTFSPNTNCTRGQIVTFLYRAR